jgi:hypothetical protein
MNQRIDQLWGQALDAAVPETYTRLSHSQVLKIKQVFAQLIVRECTAALFDESERLSGLYSEEANWQQAEEYEIRSNQCIDDIALIEKHFGVEE